MKPQPSSVIFNNTSAVGDTKNYSNCNSLKSGYKSQSAVFQSEFAKFSALYQIKATRKRNPQIWKQAFHNFHVCKIKLKQSSDICFIAQVLTP